MEEGRIKKIGTIIVLIIIAIMLTIVGIGIMGKVLYKLNIDNPIIAFLAQKELEQESIEINWKEKYFIEEVQYNTNKETQNNLNKRNIISKINQKLKSLEEKIEKQTSEDLLGYEKFLELSYIYDKAIEYSLVSNNDANARIKVDDYWCRLDIPVNIDEKAKQLKQFNAYLKEKNINLLYVQAPYKIEKNNDYVSKIYKDNGNDNADRLINEIRQEIDYIDLRDRIKYTGKDYLELFFKTDHHWKPETGLWATGEIIDYLNKTYNYKINKELISNIENYNIEICKDSYLGSDGRYVTLANASQEDISIITPKFDTDLTVKILDKVPYKRGTFKETLMDYSMLNYKDIYRTNQYSVYGYGNKALIEIHNNKLSDGKKILIIKDSFANVITPYMALGVEDCAIIDLRYFDGSLKAYINEYNPDTIISIYYTGVLRENENMWIYK